LPSRRESDVPPTVFKGGRLIDPSHGAAAGGRDEIADVIVERGRIAAVGQGLGVPDGAEVIDAAGLVVAPGLVDVHVHFREPGGEVSETIATGARAAAAGGYTAVCAMPNTNPVTDNQAAVGFIVKQAAAADGARVFPIAALSIGQSGEQLSEFGALAEAGAVAVSDDGRPVTSSHMMRTALEYAQTFGIPVADHCEDLTLASGGSMNEGLVSTRLGLKGIPAAAEAIMVARDIQLAKLTGGHVHLCHISTAASVELIRLAKDRGVSVTAEVTPHHLTLTDEACQGYNTNAKMNPPLQTWEDVEAVRAGLVDGTLDMIATDHAPHHYESKERDFDDAPFGIIGLETALALCLTELVRSDIMSLPELVRRMSTEPARAFRLEGGTLAPGRPADLVLFDPNARWTINPSAFFSKSRNTPFAGREVVGRVVRTMVGGRTVHEAGSD
jgi:dihydroorotase